MRKKILALLLLGVISIPTAAHADTTNHLGHTHEYSESGISQVALEYSESEISPLALPCPAYGDFNHKYTNKVYLRTNTKYPTHLVEVSKGHYLTCTITQYYNVYKKTCACGASIGNEISEFSYETHSLNE